MALLRRLLRVFYVWSLTLILSLSNFTDNVDITSLRIYLTSSGKSLSAVCQFAVCFDNSWDIVRLYETEPAGSDRAVGLVITNRQIQQICDGNCSLSQWAAGLH